MIPRMILASKQVLQSIIWEVFAPEDMCMQPIFYSLIVKSHSASGLLSSAWKLSWGDERREKIAALSETEPQVLITHQSCLALLRSLKDSGLSKIEDGEEDKVVEVIGRCTHRSQLLPMTRLARMEPRHSHGTVRARVQIYTVNREQINRINSTNKALFY